MLYCFMGTVELSFRDFQNELSWNGETGYYHLLRVIRVSKLAVAKYISTYYIIGKAPFLLKEEVSSCTS